LLAQPAAASARRENCLAPLQPSDSDGSEDL